MFVFLMFRISCLTVYQDLTVTKNALFYLISPLFHPLITFDFCRRFAKVVSTFPDVPSSNQSATHSFAIPIDNDEDKSSTSSSESSSASSSDSEDSEEERSQQQKLLQLQEQVSILQRLYFVFIVRSVLVFFKYNRNLLFQTGPVL